MKNEMHSLLLDEKICFITLLQDTLQNLWQVIMRVWNKLVWTSV
jgi:hypothetical protein